MAKRDIELIVALAEGRLEDETEARALMASSERLRAIHETQTRALEATAALAPLALTNTERMILRRDLWASLTTGSPAAATRSGWGLQRVAFAAGAAILVVGLVAALGQLNLGEQDTGGVLETAETLRGSEGDDATTGTNSPPAQTTGAAAQTADLFGGYASLARSGALQYSSTEDQSTDREKQMDCLDQAGLSGHIILGDIEESGRVYLVSAADENRIVSAAGETQIGPETPIAFVDRDTCDLVLLDG